MRDSLCLACLLVIGQVIFKVIVLLFILAISTKFIFQGPYFIDSASGIYFERFLNFFISFLILIKF